MTHTKGCSLAALACVLPALLLVASGCGRKDSASRSAEALAKTNAVKQEILDAINADDLSKVRSLVPPEGTTDLDTQAYKTALDVAADHFAEVRGTDSAARTLSAIEALSRPYRHLIGKSIELVGKLSPGLTDQGGGNFTSGVLTLRTGDGGSHPVAISKDETEYAKNASLDGQRFLVNFDATYKISGVVIDNVVQAERVEITSPNGSGNGMVIPVSLVLQSTENIVAPHIEAYDAKKKLTKKDR